MSNHKYLDLEGLSLYTEHVKQYIDNGDSEFLTCTWDGSQYIVEGTHEFPENNFKKITVLVKDTSPEGPKRLTITWNENVRSSFFFKCGKNDITFPIQGGTILDGILMTTPVIDGENTTSSRPFFFITGDIHVPYTSDEIKQINWE